MHLLQLEPGSRNRLEEDWEPIIDYAPAASKERKKPENRLLLPFCSFWLVTLVVTSSLVVTRWGNFQLERCLFLPTAARGALRALRSAGKELFLGGIPFSLP